MNNIIILSNTCIGCFLKKKINDEPYNNPFIATLIPNDMDYLKFINNLEYYLNFKPVLGEPKNDSLFFLQNNGLWYKHHEIKTPYPVIYIDDIEIHAIHEVYEQKEIYLDKFCERYERMKSIINSGNYKIVCLFSYSEFINDHDNLTEIIDLYLLDISSINIEKYFIGPSVFNNGSSKYINIKEWDNCNMERDDSHIYKFNDQPFSINTFLKHIKL